MGRVTSPELISLDNHDVLVDSQARTLLSVPTQIGFGLSDKYPGGIYENTEQALIQLCGGQEAFDSEEFARFSRPKDYSGREVPFWVAGKFAALLAYNRWKDGIPSSATTVDTLYTFATSLHSQGIQNSRRSGLNAVRHGLRRYLIEDADSTQDEVRFAYRLTAELDSLHRSKVRKNVLGATVLAGAAVFTARKIGG